MSPWTPGLFIVAWFVTPLIKGPASEGRCENLDICVKNREALPFDVCSAGTVLFMNQW